ncbi:MAG: type II toxin-antitoxin system YafQ family toxin [Candidatus Gracilibacteria bacterium]|nr:type II toxin-antitoxin system YafQ family toxin [Candidatus Gracilibacteria bacterium]
MYELVPTKNFKKGLKRYRHEKKTLFNLRKVLNCLQKGVSLPAKYRDHNLRGRRADYRECHVRPDLLLVYYVEEAEKRIYLQEIGSHSEIFG